jgi:exopolysaccharide biosynthesis WecB/TagA/CpsF family protein
VLPFTERASGGEVVRTFVAGVPVDTIGLRELIDLMVERAPMDRRDGIATLVFDCNGHALSLAARDVRYRLDLLSADIIHADGQVIVAASRLYGSFLIPDRSATTDMFIDSLDAAKSAGVRYFLLGGTEEVNHACAAELDRRAPGLVVGRHHGFWSEAAEADLIDQINAAQPDVIWVGLGKPREQAFCVRHRMDIAGGWLVTCGGLFNFVTGHYPRAPKWMQTAGLEWLHRAITNPRLLWRYLVTNPHAMWLIWRHRRGSDASR